MGEGGCFIGRIDGVLSADRAPIQMEIALSWRKVASLMSIEFFNHLYHSIWALTQTFELIANHSLLVNQGDHV
jgi:hypothetical protein